MTSKMMRSVVCLILLFGILSATGVAGNKDRIGTAGAQELLIPVGGAGVAIGGSAGVFLTGIDALYYNPAGLGRMPGSFQASFSQMNYIADIAVTYGAVGMKVGDFGNLGLSLKTLSFGSIPVTTVEFPDGTGASYNPTYLTLGLTYSRLLTDRISFGATAYLVSEKILDMSASGLAFDIGIQYHNLGIKGLMLGIAVKSIGPNMSFSGPDALVQANVDGTNRGTQPYVVQMAGFEMPTMMELGVAYSPKLDDMNSVTLSGLFRNNNYTDDEYQVGAEYSFDKMFFVRGGYTMAPQMDKDAAGVKAYLYGFTAGAGIKYSLGDVNLSVDYAYRAVRYFSGNQVITIGIGL
jgi:hypothetical protein